MKGIKKPRLSKPRIGKASAPLTRPVGARPRKPSVRASDAVAQTRPPAARAHQGLDITIAPAKGPFRGGSRV